MRTEIDVVLINPGDRKQVFQNLDADFSAIEPPFWVAVIAAYLRKCGFSVAIIDANADNITPDEAATQVKAMGAMLSVVVVYGSQPSASTQNMTIAGRICKALKDGTSTKVAIGGLHPSALPLRTFTETGVDFVIEGEGPYTLKDLIQCLKAGSGDYSKVPGLWYGNGEKVINTARAPLITDLDEMLPLAAWDLLPMKKYRAHNWHCFDDLAHRMPYGAIYTSLGCPFSCVFCCINAPFGKPGIRYRSPELIIDELGDLVKNYGVKNVKIVDELFVFSEPHYMGIVELILQRGYDFNIWAYARVDTVKVANLKKMKKAGINWLALGIESANPDVRDGASKKMRVKDIKSVVGAIQDAGIRVIGNYIFGLPDDTHETMQETLDMAIDLKCEFTNIYCAMAYPGSKLYDIAVAEGWELPGQWHGYSQHSYETLPLPTKHLKAEDVLRFRDNAFQVCYSDPGYLDMVQGKFGPHVKSHIAEMNSIRLKRKLLGDY
ncbi:Radical SAM domain-containing protein [Candidatus Magnetobacterium bavaricum]|uniref:Radical SAM domain-containing protein n=1 Tax=Candidatus Magnetobacterium bavaricum TaxID=29290 RepID=A0A0F3GQH3_9BACT|nr:Radical SAM domain-containing protein [Candidatus Magnetobacterium bavaricum]